MEYTLDELVTAVGAQIAAAGLDRQTNGQVSAFPDRRTLRYYTTIGLMDRPDAVRDRQAIYREHHVAQAVAVKRLQATGLALAAIQNRLAGLPMTSIEEIASGVSSPATEDAAVAGNGDGPRGRFWAQALSPAPLVEPRETSLEPSAALIDPPRPMLAIPLTSDATLLLSVGQPLSAEDVAGIRRAAAALIDHLAATGSGRPHLEKDPQ